MCHRRGAQRRVPQSATNKETNRTFKNIRVEFRKQIPTYDTNRAGVTNCRERANLSAWWKKNTYQDIQVLKLLCWSMEDTQIDSEEIVARREWLRYCTVFRYKARSKLCTTCLKRGKEIKNKFDTESWVVLQLKPVTRHQKARTVAAKYHRLLVKLK